MGYPSTEGLSLTIDDSSAREIVGRERDPDLVSGNNAYVVLSHLARKMREDNMTIFQFDAKHSVGERLFDNALNFDRFLFCHSSLPMNGLILWKRNIFVNLIAVDPGPRQTRSPVDFLMEIIHGWMLKNQGVGR